MCTDQPYTMNFLRVDLFLGSEDSACLRSEYKLRTVLPKQHGHCQVSAKERCRRKKCHGRVIEMAVPLPYNCTFPLLQTHT